MQEIAAKIAANGNSHESMSSREQEVLSLLLKGDSSKEIASKLNISPRTVDYHRNNIYKKLGVHNYQELVAKYSGVETQASAQTELQQAELPTKFPSEFAHSRTSKLSKLHKFLIPAAIFVLFCLVIPLWFLIIKSPSSKYLEKTPGFIDYTYDTLHLRADRYSDDDLHGQCYASYLNDMKLRHFYTGTFDDLLPIPYEWYTVRISGIAEMELKNVKLNLAFSPYRGSWIYLGGGENKYVDISPGYFSKEIQILKRYYKAYELPPGEYVVILLADLFQVQYNYPENNFDTGLRIPDDVPDFTVMTTIRNFKIEPVLTP